MSTKTLIDRIQPHAQGYTREGTRSIIKLIEQGQDELFDTGQSACHFVPSDNQGFPPYLKTTAETYRYDINATNIASTLAMTVGGASRTIRAREVKKVFVDATLTGYADKWLGEPFIWNFSSGYGITDSRLRVAEIPCTKMPARERDVANITFFDDPETTTDKHFCDFVYEPSRLTSASMPLFVTQRFELALEEYVIGRVQWYANKKWNELLEHFEKYWKPEFKSLMRQGGGGFNYETITRLC